jgi:hypothetical protein
MNLELIVYETPHEHPSSGPIAVSDRVELEGDIFVERLDRDLMRTAKRACLFSGHNWDPSEQAGCLYAFAKEVPRDRRWDEDGYLTEAIALSRLCHPTSIALEYSATVTFGARGQIHQVIPAAHQGHGAQAFVADTTLRNWLTPTDLVDLPDLMRALRTVPRPGRVANAIWLYEYAARTEEISVRWTLTVTAIEALCHVERNRSTSQFVVGVLGLAQRLELPWTEDEARTVYSDRSAFAHGATVQNTAAPGLLIRAEALIRAASKRALLDPAFAALFSDPVTVRAAFPL